MGLMFLSRHIREPLPNFAETKHWSQAINHMGDLSDSLTWNVTRALGLAENLASNVQAERYQRHGQRKPGWCVPPIR